MRPNIQILLANGMTKKPIDKNIEHRAVCICTDLWSVQTTSTYKRNTLVHAETAEQAKEKVRSYLSGIYEKYTWPQHTPYIFGEK